VVTGGEKMSDLPKPRRKSGIVDADDGGGEWLATFADLMTLLLTFFVLLFSLSSVNNVRFREILTELQLGLGAKPRQPAVFDDILRDRLINIFPGATRQSVAADLRQLVRDEKLEGAEVVDMGEQGALLRIGGHILFSSGSAEIHPSAGNILDKIAVILLRNPEYHLDIKGHTDNIPISTPTFASNWELSALRATAVLRRLLERNVPSWRMTATGYADTQPLAANFSPAGRKRNRRVEFLFTKGTLPGDLLSRHGEGRRDLPQSGRATEPIPR
jgi:chemotaxis protein MotB